MGMGPAGALGLVGMAGPTGCSTPVSCAPAAGGIVGGVVGGLGALAGSASSLRGSSGSFGSALAGRPPPSPALCSTGRAPGPPSSAVPSPVAATPMDRGLPNDLAAVQDSLGNMSVSHTAGSSSLGMLAAAAVGGGGGAPVASGAGSTVARELMFNMA